MVRFGPSERPFFVAEKGGLGELAAKRRAVDVNEFSAYLAVGFFKFVDLVRKLAFAGSCRACKQNRV